MFFKILLAFFVHIVVGIVVLVRGCIYLCERKEENCVGAFLVFFFPACLFSTLQVKYF